MSSRRLVRVAEVLRDEISRLISRERLLEGMLLTVTQVDVTPDLKQAYVYCTSLNADVPAQEWLARLNNLHHAWQKTLGAKIQTKFTPRLFFRLDDAQQRGDRVMQILSTLDNLDISPAEEKKEK